MEWNVGWDGMAWLIIIINRYVLFSIGNIKPLFQAVYASCWNSYKICNKTWVQAVDYLEICGIIVGQILVGVLGDWYVFDGRGARSGR